MPKWEYRTVSFQANVDASRNSFLSVSDSSRGGSFAIKGDPQVKKGEFLNRLGNEGWEIIELLGPAQDADLGRYLLKRAKTE